MSGRYGGKPTVEGCHSIILDLDGLLALREHRTQFTAELTGTAGTAYDIRLDIQLDGEEGLLTVQQGEFQHHTNPVLAASYCIELTSDPGRFGGRRWYAICPVSRRRVLRLYLPSGAQQFASRSAYELGYRSQRVGVLERSHARLAKLHAQLSGAYQGPSGPIPPKPPNMHWSTYDRLVNRITDARRVHEAMFLPALINGCRTITGHDFDQWR